MTTPTEFHTVTGIDIAYTADETPEQWFTNYYRCTDCKVEWDNEWDCMVNDKCPECNKEIEPYESEDANMPFDTDGTGATLGELTEHGIVLHMDGGVVHDATCNGKAVPVRIVAHDHDIEDVDPDEREILTGPNGRYIIVEIA